MTGDGGTVNRGGRVCSHVEMCSTNGVDAELVGRSGGRACVTGFDERRQSRGDCVDEEHEGPWKDQAHQYPTPLHSGISEVRRYFIGANSFCCESCRPIHQTTSP